MEKLTPAQQKFINEMSRTALKNKNPYNATGNALKRKGLVFFAVFVGWCVTAEGMKYVKE